MTEPTSHYTARLERLEAEHARLDRRSRQIGNLNLAFLFGAFALLAVAAFRSDPRLIGAAAVVAIAFVSGLVIQQRVNRALQIVTARATLQREGLARLTRAWRTLPEPAALGSATTPSPIDAATAADLDLLGRASLEQLLGAACTPVGRRTVQQWILNPASPAVARARQQCVAELAPQAAFREEIGVRGRLLATDEDRYARFMAWAEGESWLHANGRWRWIARLLPLAVLGLGAAWLAGYPVLTPLLGLLLINGIVLLTVGRRAGDEISRVAAQQGAFTAYAGLFAMLAAHQAAAPELVQLQARFGAGEQRADLAMRRLARLMPLVDIRRSLYFFPVEVATLWSFHVLWLLERWQRRYGGQVRGWLEALGEGEALITLATLHFDHPAWAFPTLHDAGVPTLVAHGLAHPLLPPTRAVGNDVTVGPPGSYLLVTGSNMSGKSTLLRALGVNVVLAQMGGPVCAAALELPPLAVVTSMRVQDSLEAGVSFYMAELRRLKAIVDQADVCAGLAGPRLLYLLDEILQGTNTAERQIAARHIIRHLIDTGAIGAVSTHDLTLADAPELKPAAQEVYFTEQFTRSADGPTMSFDYRLRPGLAVSTNALKLMELVGLLSTQTGRPG